MNHTTTPPTDDKTPKPTPTVFQKKACWAALSSFSVLIMLCMAVAVIAAVIKLLGFLSPILIPIMIATIIAYLLNPLVDKLVSWKLPRQLAVVIVLLVTLSGVIGFGATFLPKIVKETAVLIENREQHSVKVQQWLNETIEDNDFLTRKLDDLYQDSLNLLPNSNYEEEDIIKFQTAPTSYHKLEACVRIQTSNYLSSLGLDSFKTLPGMIWSWVSAGSKAIFSQVSLMVGILAIPIFVFYFLIEAENIKEKWPSVLPLQVSHFRHEVVETMEEINDHLIAFFRGQMLVSIIEGILIAICLSIYGLPYAMTIGLAICVLGIVPYLGILSTWIPAALIAWGQPDGGLQSVLIVSCIFLAVNQLDSWVIQPKIVGDKVGLHEFTVLLSVLIWTIVIGGLLGALLAVPLTAAIKVIYKRYIWQATTTPPLQNEPEESPQTSPLTTDAS